MSYFLVAGQPVFLSTSRYGALLTEALSDETSKNRVRASIAGTAEHRRSVLRMQNLLKSKYSTDPVRFYSEWVDFDFADAEARDNVSDLLYDYCDLHGCGRLIDFRDSTQRLLDAYECENLSYPFGMVFGLEFDVGLRPLWLRTFLRSKNLRVIIATQLVSRLKGTLSDFTMYSLCTTIRFNSNGVVLQPSNL